MGRVDLEERVARLEAELSLLKWQNRLKNDSLLARMARRWANMDFRQTSPAFIPGNPPGLIFTDNEVETQDQVNIVSNLMKLTASPWTQRINANQICYQLRMGGGGDGFSIARRSVSETGLNLLMVLGPQSGESSASLALYSNGSKPTQIAMAHAVGINPFTTLALDTAGNTLIGTSSGGGTQNHTIVQNDFLFAGGVTATNGGLVNKVKAGVPTDADCTNPQSGHMIIDSTDSKIYVRIGSTWKGVAVA